MSAIASLFTAAAPWSAAVPGPLPIGGGDTANPTTADGTMFLQALGAVPFASATATSAFGVPTTTMPASIGVPAALALQQTPLAVDGAVPSSSLDAAPLSLPDIADAVDSPHDATVAVAPATAQPIDRTASQAESGLVVAGTVRVCPAPAVAPTEPSADPTAQPASPPVDPHVPTPGMSAKRPTPRAHADAPVAAAAGPSVPPLAPVAQDVPTTSLLTASPASPLVAVAGAHPKPARQDEPHDDDVVGVDAAPPIALLPNLAPPAARPGDPLPVSVGTGAPSDIATRTPAAAPGPQPGMTDAPAQAMAVPQPAQVASPPVPAPDARPAPASTPTVANPVAGTVDTAMPAMPSIAKPVTRSPRHPAILEPEIAPESSASAAAPATGPTPTPPTPPRLRAGPAAAAIVETGGPTDPTVTATPGRIGRQVGVAIARSLAAGTGETLTVRLDPAAFGRIEVKLAFDDTATLRAVVAADSPAALDMLRRDSGDLTRALADAGVRADSQSLRFDDRPASTGDGATGNGNGAGTGTGTGAETGGRSGQQPRLAAIYRTIDRSGDDAAATDDYRPLPMRGGIDLMA